jgi:hypothetical protein
MNQLVITVKITVGGEKKKIRHPVATGSHLLSVECLAP